ncbi:hypothetical protein ACGYK5_17920 [Sulfitobacter sp. 1A16787]|uniref:hypothetical protein n=1 Tax=Sulfitobacter sp. 1A16787 TaxID=3368571 RepID=UPI003746ED3A
MSKHIRRLAELVFLPAAICTSLSNVAAADEWSGPNDEAGILLSEISQLDGKEFSGSGLLKKAFLQFDKDKVSYLLQIGNRRYPVNLDDGREASKRAEECDTAEFIGLNPTLGCKVSFDAEYSISEGDAGVRNISDHVEYTISMSSSAHCA